MRILLAAKHAPDGSRPIGGVQSWCRTVAAELRRRGHEAVTWGPEQPRPAGRFDLGIIANAGDTFPAFDLCQRVIVVSHGIIQAEQPVAGCRMVFTSEGVRDHWHSDGPVIRQPIDTEFWFDAGYQRDGIMRYSYRGGLPWLAEMARDMGMNYCHVRNVSPAYAREAMQRASVVLATGRAAIEAAACGAPVVICDHRSAYQPPLAAMFGMEQAKQNYSGRGGQVPNMEIVRGLIDQALAGSGWRDYVQAHHSASTIVDQLLEAAC